MCLHHLQIGLDVIQTVQQTGAGRFFVTLGAIGARVSKRSASLVLGILEDGSVGQQDSACDCLRARSLHLQLQLC